MSKTEKSTARASAMEISQALDQTIAPEQIAKVLRDALSATVTTRAGVIEPDTRSRLQAAGMILAYQVGTPIQRTESVTVNLDADSAVGMEERLRHSPALRGLLKSMLVRVEGDTSIKH